MSSGKGDGPLRPPGSPIRKPPDPSLVTDSPGLIAGSYVLHRLLLPRHPPGALTNLATPEKTDARVHCAVLKKRTAPHPPPHRQEDMARQKQQPSGRSLTTQQRARPA